MKERCYCGTQDINPETAFYSVGTTSVCSRACYNKALEEIENGAKQLKLFNGHDYSRSSHE